MWCLNGSKPAVKLSGRVEGVIGGVEAHGSGAVLARWLSNGIKEYPESGICALRVANGGPVAGEDNRCSEKKSERSS